VRHVHCDPNPRSEAWNKNKNETKKNTHLSFLAAREAMEDRTLIRNPWCDPSLSGADARETV